MPTYSFHGCPGAYRICRQEDGSIYRGVPGKVDTCIAVPAKYEHRLEYIRRQYAGKEEVMQGKLQTLYLFLLTAGESEIPYEQMGLFDEQ